MSAASGRWLHFEHFRDCGWKDESIHSAYLGKVFYIWNHRNAWWGYESNRYPADAFFPTPASAKDAIEEMRTQGSQWRIHELPALVVCTPTNYLAVTEINTAEPLAELAHQTDAELRTLEQVGNALGPLRDNSVIRTVGEPKLLPPAELPFRLHHPRSQGPKEIPFWWWSTISEVEIGPVMSFVVAVSEQLQRAGRQISASA